MTGHSYIVYGPLANATTSVMYEGTPDTPGAGPLVADHREVQGQHPLHRPDHHPHLHEVGRGPAGRATTSPACACSARWASPSTPRRGSGTAPTSAASDCPIVDTWWQTETGGILITPLPGITATKPGAAMTPFPGIAADIIDNDGRSVGNDEGGYLVITEPWPGMLRGI